MGVHRYRDLIAWQLAEEFKREVLTIVNGSSLAKEDLRFRSQLLECSRAVSKDIAEGFLRFSPGYFISFLDYALGSLGEAERRLIDGVELKYFSELECQEARRFAKRCMVATIRLKQSQVRRRQEQRDARMARRRR
jgi:four helix bundle protein